MQMVADAIKVIGRDLLKQVEKLKDHKSHIWYLSKMPDIPKELLDRLERAEICIEMALEHLAHAVNGIEGKEDK